jgi:hypothetical protein
MDQMLDARFSGKPRDPRGGCYMDGSEGVSSILRVETHDVHDALDSRHGRRGKGICCALDAAMRLVSTIRARANAERRGGRESRYPRVRSPYLAIGRSPRPFGSASSRSMPTSMMIAPWQTNCVRLPLRLFGVKLSVKHERDIEMISFASYLPLFDKMLRPVIAVRLDCSAKNEGGYRNEWRRTMMWCWRSARLKRQRGQHARKMRETSSTALEIVNERSARGEVDKADFEEKRRIITEAYLRVTRKGWLLGRCSRSGSIDSGSLQPLRSEDEFMRPTPSPDSYYNVGPIGAALLLMKTPARRCSNRPAIGALGRLDPKGSFD